MMCFTFRILLLPLLLACMGQHAYAASYDKYVQRMQIDDNTRTIYIYMDDAFTELRFTEKSVRKIYKNTRKSVRKALPRQYADYDVRIITKGIAIENLIENEPEPPAYTDKPKRKKKRGWWGNIAYDGKPWVTNTSLPHAVSSGLQGKHIALWASHGRFYDTVKGEWRWQRPNMFCTNEDLFTQTIVVPYLIPMLERAGANVFTPRERDWQTAEVVVEPQTALTLMV